MDKIARGIILEKAYSESGYIADFETDEDLVTVDIEYEPLILPVKQYEFFMANGAQGIEAMTLLLHLLYTSRRQHTNQVWAANTYLRQGLDMGERTVIRAKKFLHDHGFISYHQAKDEASGQFSGKNYIRVNYMRNPGPRQVATGVEQTPSTAATAIAVPAYKCLKKQSKCLKKQASNGNAYEDKPADACKGKFDDLREAANKATGLELGEPKFSETMEKVFAKDARLAQLDFITCTYEATKKKNGGAGLLLAMLLDRNKQEAFLDRFVRVPAYHEHTCKVCGKVSHSSAGFCPDCGADETSDVERLRQIYELAGGGAAGCAAVRDDMTRETAPMFGDMLARFSAKATA